MLKRLTIKNVALISMLELNFCNHLNVLSGETGAGKSIIVDSLMLLLGNRYDKTLLRYGEDSGWVEGVFESNENINSILQYYGIDPDDQIIVSRKFNIDGRNDIRINGRTITTSVLKQIMSHLIDICGQNEHQSLGNIENHLLYLDYYARHSTEEIKNQINKYYNEYQEIKAKLDKIGDESEREINIEIYKKQIAEIKDANISPNEEDELILTKKRLTSFEQIKNSLSSSYQLLTGGDNNSIEFLDEAINQISKVEDYNAKFSDLKDRLDSVLIEVNDISDCLYGELDNLYFSQDELDRVEERLNLIRSLRRKYGSYETMMEKYNHLVETCELLENANEIYDELFKKKENLVDCIYTFSRKLSIERKQIANKLSKDLLKELNELGIKGQFEVKFNDFPTRDDVESKITPSGLDDVEFYLSPNVGQPLKPLVKIVSGGELSRLMLAFKIIFSNIDQIPTLIFDEIDAGISGAIGFEVAKKLAKLSKKHQLLCVTHLSQIAAMADKNFFISKYSQKEQTFTKVNLLKDDNLLGEIARLSGNKDIKSSSSAYSSAKEIKEWSNEYKKNLK